MKNKTSDFLTMLIDSSISDKELENIDCYLRPQMGLFIPAESACGYPLINAEKRPSYMILISFSGSASDEFHYNAEIISPYIAGKADGKYHYYCLTIAADFFEKRYALYSSELPVFSSFRFEICSDILKALNTFAFESGKSMMNSDITLNAQSEIITHWIIRSVLGETMDMRAVSDDYSVAKAQHYMELHYGSNITVSMLAKLGNISESTFNRRFKKETGKTPIEYLIEVRINHAKIMLRRKNLPVTEIALRCGFSSSAHFTSCFQQRTGHTPSEYRSLYIE